MKFNLGDELLEGGPFHLVSVDYLNGLKGRVGDLEKQLEVAVRTTDTYIKYSQKLEDRLEREIDAGRIK